LSNNEIEEEVIDMTTVEVDNAPVEDATAPPEPETQAEPDADSEGDAADTFPRKVVENLRKQSATYREQLKAAEGQVAALQRQTVNRLVANASMRPAALWAVTQLDDLLAEDGTVDAAKVKGAMDTARRTLGVTGGPRRFRGLDGLVSGATGRDLTLPENGFESAFKKSQRE
jgi:hypothetical protein